MASKTVLVIGTGFSGIISIVHLKAEGIKPVCYERSDTYGGTWYYRSDVKNTQASLMPTTVINHSKEMGALSNFPPNKEYSNFMRHTQVYQYLTDYVKHNDCEKYIHYHMEVQKVVKAKDYEETGKWSVTTKNLTSGVVITEVFDGVFVATGHNNMPTMPKFPGQENFTGQIMHTHSLKGVEEFANKRVAIVGIGCSALDAAVEISRVAKQVYISTRSGAYIVNRIGGNGYPIDIILLRRYLAIFLDYLPFELCSWYVENFYMDTCFDHRLYHVKPKYHILSRDPYVSDHIGSKLLSGAVIQKTHVTKIGTNGVFFEGEDNLTEVDSVIMATGYTWGFPFLLDGIVKEENGILHLYKCVYPADLPHPTLAIIGFINPYGAIFPLIEAQVRWAAYLLASGGKLPSKEIMMKDIIERHKSNERRFTPSEKMTVRVDYVQYQDELTKEIGVKPNLLKYLFTDFSLFIKLLFGPSVPYQYRLEGHGKWEGAREAIMTVQERVEWPLSKRPPIKKGIVRYIFDYIINMIPLNVHIWK